MLIVHHLGKSQSERIVWLCEELGVSYELRRYSRDPNTMLAPPEYKALHPLGAAPVITDGEVVMAESAAIVEYIIARHGNGRLTPGPSHPDHAQYVYWFHFANGSLQPVMGRNLVLSRAKLAPDHPVLLATKARLDLALKFVDDRLRQSDYLATGELTAADIMTVFVLTTMRYFYPVDLAPYPHILRYLRRIGEREAYRRAMLKGDPEMKPLLT